ncbi:MAG TPA: alpha/beta fold hydrolase [Flavitalea sp.]|nr:alpha/beta fold hydrolase [Flavitalea sp.]
MATRIGSLLLMIMISFTACKKSEDAVLLPRPEPGPLPTGPVSLVLSKVSKSIAPEIGGFYQALPSNYDSSSEQYPVIIFLHGAAQLGNGRGELGRTLYYGAMQMIKDSMMPVSFSSREGEFTYLYFAPQFKTLFSVEDLNTFVDYVSSNYRISKNRIYLLGLSMGGRLACQYAARYGERIAAVVSMAGGLKNDPARPELASKIASSNVAVWAIHNNKDQMVETENSITLISLLQKNNPEMEARLTLLSPMGASNHDAWTRACKLDFREDGKNIYEWFLEYSK